MNRWQRCKQWVGDTLSFKYIKGLISDHTNDNLKEFIGTVLAGELVIVIAYAVYIAKDDAAVLNIIFYIMCFISVLFGIEGVVRFLTKSSDNTKEKEIEVAKCNSIKPTTLDNGKEELP